jgi:hypothetical protein
LGFLLWVPIVNKYLEGTTAIAAEATAAPKNLRLEILEFFILVLLGRFGKLNF